MLLKCEIQVNNRLIQPQNHRAAPRCSRGAVGIYRKSGSEQESKKIYYIVVFTGKAKAGDRYRVKLEDRPNLSLKAYFLFI